MQDIFCLEKELIEHSFFAIASPSCHLCSSSCTNSLVTIRAGLSDSSYRKYWAFFFVTAPLLPLMLWSVHKLWSLLELGSQTQAIGNIERSFATASLVPLLLWSVHKLSGHYYSWALFCNCLRPCVILVLCSLLWLWSLLELGSQTRASLFLVTATGALALTNPEYTRPWIDNLTVIFMRYLAPSVSMP